MPGIRKMRSAARYGARHLTTINEDVGNEPAYSRAMRSDLNLAIALLNNAPEMVRLIETLVDYVDAGCEDLQTSAATGRRILAAIKGE